MQKYDYLIVGAGSAGCVLANRLSQDKNNSVCLLEAGGSDKTFWIQMPIGYGRTFKDPKVNWMYQAEPDPTLADRCDYWPRGKVLGGSSSINAMVYVRGQPQDFDDWAAEGNPGWGWQEVLPFFKKSEDHDLGSSEYHGSGGPLHVSDISDKVHPLCQTFIQSCQKYGFQHTADFNGENTEGVGIYQINTRNGFRASTSNAFLRPALKRQNLTLLTKAHVTRILFDGCRAVGVEYESKGKRQQIHVNKEVILSGGAINSPQLLQLSGIGQRSLLEQHGIEVIVDSKAVGQNMQDHIAVSYFYKSKKPTLNNELYPLIGKIKAGLQYILTRTGPLSLSVNQSGGFVCSDASQTLPNLQLYFNPVSYYETLNKQRKLMNPDPYAAFILGFNACRPNSCGHLEIRSNNPFEQPAIYPNALATEEDIDDVLAGTRLLRQLIQISPLADIIEKELLPGPSKQSDDELLQDFRERAATVYHPVSTCKMGPDPATSVVDARLKVHGVENLRVIDASIFPRITSGNTNAPTIMVAEKGAAMLIEDNASGLNE